LATRIYFLFLSIFSLPMTLRFFPIRKNIDFDQIMQRNWTAFFALNHERIITIKTPTAVKLYNIAKTVTVSIV
jgi:hypothetical protein